MAAIARGDGARWTIGQNGEVVAVDVPAREAVFEGVCFWRSRGGRPPRHREGGERRREDQGARVASEATGLASKEGCVQGVGSGHALA